MFAKRGIASAMLVAVGIATSIAQAQSLTTGEPNNGSGGVWFDLTALNAPLEVTGFDIAFTGTAGTFVNVEVWTRPGSYVGFETSSAGWTLRDTVSVQRLGTSVLSPLVMTQLIELPENQTVAVYLQALESGGIRYNGTAANPPQTLWSNADLSLFTNNATTASAAFPTSTLSGRAFAGTVHYQAGGPAIPGACCFSDGSCQQLMGGDCFTQGGVFNGGGSDCATANCPQPAACCFPNGSCEVLLQTACDAQGGTFNAGAATCAAANCPQPPTGACCFADGSCIVDWEPGCLAQNGIYRGDNTDCATANCPTGLTTTFDGTLTASVNNSGVFFDVTADNAAGIVIDAFHTNSNAAAGTPLIVAVWTKPAGFAGSEQNQAEWNFLGDAMTTSAGPGNPTLVPIGGLHIAQDETYGIRMTMVDGSHRYSNEASTLPIHSNSDLTITLGAVQNSNWGSVLSGTRGWNGTVFYSVGATVEVGACCFPSGACSDVSDTFCLAAGGIFQGANSECATTNCPQPPTGACCLPIGDCVIEWETGCLDQGGTYYGDNSTCEGRECPSVIVFPQLPHAGANTIPFSQAPGTTMHQVYSSDQFAAISGGEPIEISRMALSSTNTGTVTGHLVIRLGYTNALGGVLASAGGLDIPDVGGGGAPNAIGPMHEFYSGPINHTGDGDIESFDFSFDGVPFIYDPTLGNLLEELYITDQNGSLSISRAAGGPLGSRVYHRHQGTTSSLTAQAHRVRMTFSIVDESCYANCDNSTTEPILNVDDFTCFINEFAQALNLPHEQQVAHYANCDGSTTAPVLNVDDFTCFINAFAAGCP